jgi:hypothetical protein
MSTANIWRVTITRLDKSKHRFSEPHAGQPRRGQIIETVVGRRLVKAEVELFYLDDIRPGRFAAWKVDATEI